MVCKTPFGLPVEPEVYSMNNRMAGHDQSLNAPLKHDTNTEWQDWIENKEESQETNEDDDWGESEAQEDDSKSLES